MFRLKLRADLSRETRGEVRRDRTVVSLWLNSSKALVPITGMTGAVNLPNPPNVNELVRADLVVWWVVTIRT